MEALVASGKKASELADIMKKYPQVLVNAYVANTKKYGYLEDKEIADLSIIWTRSTMVMAVYW